jgi:hypothetical protein
VSGAARHRRRVVHHALRGMHLGSQLRFDFHRSTSFAYFFEFQMVLFDFIFEKMLQMHIQ